MTVDHFEERLQKLATFLGNLPARTIHMRRQGK